jgi:hypothetical protein
MPVSKPLGAGAPSSGLPRRQILLGGIGLAVVTSLPKAAFGGDTPRIPLPLSSNSRRITSTITTKDGTQIFYKDYAGLPHGMATTHADVINADLLDFIKG